MTDRAQDHAFAFASALQTPPRQVEALRAAIEQAIAEGLTLEQAKPRLERVLGSPSDAEAKDQDVERILRLSSQVLDLLRAELGNDLEIYSDQVVTALVIVAHALIPNPEFRSRLLASGFGQQA